MMEFSEKVKKNKILKKSWLNLSAHQVITPSISSQTYKHSITNKTKISAIIFSTVGKQLNEIL
jgi:hypothetical protein